ncbi:hypothetical protein N0V94_004179 [Neodidymelliopsis sp. IMI 364377]|nr:hypothetical protein N0V94_004179 [Neodidymelliopsis sp. IMI 364377]
MAIHHDHPGLEVSIIVNGEALQESRNDDEEDRPREVTRYAQVSSDVPFGIRYSMKSALLVEHSIEYMIELDGEKATLLTALKALDSIPRTPSPPPLEDRPIEDLSTTELVELVKRYRNEPVSSKKEHLWRSGNTMPLTRIETMIRL